MTLKKPYYIITFDRNEDNMIIVNTSGFNGSEDRLKTHFSYVVWYLREQTKNLGSFSTFDRAFLYKVGKKHIRKTWYNWSDREFGYLKRVYFDVKQPFGGPGDE